MKKLTQDEIIKQLKTKRYASIKILKKLMSKQIVKQFSVPRFWKDSKQPVLCQIKNCKEVMAWITVTKKEDRIHLCFSHGEQL